MKNIDPTIIRVGSILKYKGSYWVAVHVGDIENSDLLPERLINIHGWFFRKSDLPCPPSEPEKKDQMNWAPFFTCFVEGTNGGLHVHHHNIGIARAEAERLSGLSQNMGRKVVVMQARAYCKSTKPEVKWEG